MSTGEPPQAQPEFSEEELAALEAEMERVTVDDVLLQTVVSLINLSARKAGLTSPPGEGPEPAWDQVRLGIDGARADAAARAAPRRAALPDPRRARPAADALRALERRRRRARRGCRAAARAARPWSAAAARAGSAR